MQESVNQSFETQARLSYLPVEITGRQINYYNNGNNYTVLVLSQIPAEVRGL